MKNDKIRAPKLIFALPRLCKYLTGGIKCGRITGNSTKIWQVKMKKQDNTVSNNYEDYKARNEAAKASSDSKAPQFTLRYLLVFGLTIVMFICMMLPDFQAYIWSDSLGWPRSKGLVYSGSVFSLLKMFGNVGGSIDMSGGTLQDIVKDNPIIDMFLNGSSEFEGTFSIIKILTIVLVIELIFVAVQFVLSMCACVGAKKLDVLIKTVSFVNIALSIAAVVLSALIYVKTPLFYQTVCMVVKCSYGSMVVLAVSIAQAAVALFVRR